MQDKIYELSLGAARQKRITEADRTQIESTIAEYKQQ